MTKKSERAKLNKIKKMLLGYDEVECEYFVFGNQPVFIYHQDGNLNPLIVVRPEWHSAFETKQIINDSDYSIEYDYWCLDDDKDRKYLEKYF